MVFVVAVLPFVVDDAFAAFVFVAVAAFDEPARAAHGLLPWPVGNDRVRRDLVPRWILLVESVDGGARARDAWPRPVLR